MMTGLSVAAVIFGVTIALGSGYIVWKLHKNAD